MRLSAPSIRTGWGLAIAISIAVIGLLAIVALFVRHDRRTTWPPPHAAKYAADVAKQFAAEPSAPVDRPAEVAEAMARFPRAGAVLEDEARAALVSMLTGFFAARADGGANTYENWMTDRGYRIRQIAPDWDDLAEMSRFYGRAQAPQDETLLNHFRFCYEASMQRDRGGASVRRISTGPDAGAFHFGVLREQPSRKRSGLNVLDAIDGGVIDRRFVGEISSSTRPHWTQPETVASLAGRQGLVEVAVACLAVQGADEVWRPMSIACYRDAASGAWWIESIVYQNSYTVRSVFEW